MRSGGVRPRRHRSAGAEGLDRRLIGLLGADGCADGEALGGADSVAASPDGLNVYVAAHTSDAVVIFDRDPETGALMQKAGQLGCVSETGTGGLCGNGVALDFALGVTVTADGQSVYVASSVSGAIAVFDRNLLTGVLTQKAGTDACISADGLGGLCTQFDVLDDPVFVTASSDGGRLVRVPADSWSSTGAYRPGY